MAEDDDFNIINWMKGSNKPELEQEFIDRLYEIIFRSINVYAMLFNKIGIIDSDYARRDDGHYDLAYSLSYGVIPVLSYVNRDIASKYEEKYLKQLQNSVKKYGQDMEKWPEEAYTCLGENCFLVFSVMPSRVRKFKADFLMTVTLMLPEGKIVIRDLLERAAGLEEAPVLLSSSTQEEALSQYINDYLLKWVVPINSWLTARERRIMLYSNVCYEVLCKNMSYWTFDVTSWPRKYLYLLFWSMETDSVKIINSPAIRDKCLEITGDILKPGRPVAFVLRFNLEQKQDLEISCYGPMAYDPFNFIGVTMVAELIKNSSPIFMVTIPEDEFDTDAQVGSKGNPPSLDASAAKTAKDLLDLLQIETEGK